MKRIIVLGAAWTASAAAAVGLGFLAVSLVDASASPGTTLAAATTAPVTSTDRSASSAAPTSTVAPADVPATGEYATAGGTVFANCGNGSPLLAGVPATGWVVDDSNDPGEIEFENSDQKVEVHVACVGGAPVFSLDDSSSASRTPSSPASGTSGRGDSSDRDDSSGRGGGHGSDDGPGDDSSGRGGGGHGSDD